jgi:hypothetical protein
VSHKTQSLCFVLVLKSVVVYFSTATSCRSRGALWSIIAPPFTRVLLLAAEAQRARCFLVLESWTALSFPALVRLVEFWPLIRNQPIEAVDNNVLNLALLGFKMSFIAKRVHKNELQIVRRYISFENFLQQNFEAKPDGISVIW